MKERSFDEMVAYFNRRVSEMDIAQDYKMELLGMVTALGYKHEKTAQQWIPFKTRPLTEEEQDEHPEWDCILDCKLPDDGQQILVSVSVRGHESVQYDEFYMDDGCYLDSGYEIGTEAVAWRPLPDKYKAESEGDE